MTQHIDILDEQAELKRPFYVSLVFHVTALALLLAGGILKSDESPWGEQTALGGAVGLATVADIPLPQASGEKNRLANDTPSEAPAEEEISKADKQKDALDKLLADDLKKLSEKPRSDVKSLRKPEENQLTNPSGEKVSAPLYGGMVGSGGVGVGSNVFGNQFGAYVQAMQQRISQKWRPYEASVKARNPQPVFVSFRIMRDGTVEDVRVVQSSANAELDLSAQRAVTEAGPFEALPREYRGGSATFEVAFKVQR